MSKLGKTRPQLVGDMAPLLMRGFARFLGEDGAAPVAEV
jgi:hypothetical protein